MRFSKARFRMDRYNAMNTGICAIAGRQPASGFVSVISYNLAVAKFMDCWSSAYLSRILSM